MCVWELASAAISVFASPPRRFTGLAGSFADAVGEDRLRRGHRDRLHPVGGHRIRKVHMLAHVPGGQKHATFAVEIADRLAMASSTVQAILVRNKLNRLSHLERVTGEPIRRYERDHPGELLHMHVKKIG